MAGQADPNSESGSPKPINIKDITTNKKVAIVLRFYITSISAPADKSMVGIATITP